MKTKIISCCAGLVFLLAGCETSSFYYVMNVSNNFEYTVNHTGRFTENYEVLASEVNSDLDLPDDAIVRGVFIEALSVRTETLSENEADGIKLDGWIMTNETVQFLDEFLMPVEPGQSDFIRLGNLVTDGILKIQESFEGFILDGNPSSVGFRLEGDSDPNPGETIDMNILIEVTLSVSYELESEVPWFMKGG
ncbi:MAG: hypothetical protein ACLFUW_10620 [Bacteroidales bacterium]